MLKKKNQRKAPRASPLVSSWVKDITEYSIATNSGDLVFFIIKPTNISVLPDASVSSRIYALLNVVKGRPTSRCWH